VGILPFGRRHACPVGRLVHNDKCYMNDLEKIKEKYGIKSKEKAA
jgi:hypothetical protein